jgi:hypothetical protein
MTAYRGWPRGVRLRLLFVDVSELFFQLMASGCDVDICGNYWPPVEGQLRSPAGKSETPLRINTPARGTES